MNGPDSRHLRERWTSASACPPTRPLVIVDSRLEFPDGGVGLAQSRLTGSTRHTCIFTFEEPGRALVPVLRGLRRGSFGRFVDGRTFGRRAVAPDRGSKNWMHARHAAMPRPATPACVRPRRDPGDAWPGGGAGDHARGISQTSSTRTLGDPVVHARPLRTGLGYCGGCSPNQPSSEFPNRLRTPRASAAVTLSRVWRMARRVLAASKRRGRRTPQDTDRAVIGNPSFGTLT